MRGDANIQFWEYLWYALTTIFLLFVGLGLLIIRLIAWIFNRFRRPTMSWGMAIAAAAGIGIAATAILFFLYTRSADLGDRKVSIAVESGKSFRSVADELVTKGVVSERWMLVYPARLLKIDRRLLSGTYVFTGENSARSVLDKFARGDVELTEVTIPEGMPIWRVASVLQTKLQLDSASIMALAHDRDFLDSLEVPYLEGHLFPETYSFALGVSYRAVIAEMVQTFHDRTDSLWRQPIATGLNKYQTLVLASIIEAETPLASERSRVASVYLNRLRLGMTLDADPTVIYGLGGLDRPLIRADLDSTTIYNTYRIQGLPPTPINSPGLASILAAMRPDGSDYLYFVADGTGGHIFSRTNDEHNNARRRARLNQRN